MRNARSLKTVTSNVNKVRDFSALLELCQSDIVAVTETWLNSNITDGELFSDDYVTYRKDREVTVQNKRGILLSRKRNIPSRRRPDLEAECEIMVCEAQLVNVKKMFLFCVTDHLHLIEVYFVRLSMTHYNVYIKMKRNESDFRPPLCTYRLSWARRTSWGWWDDWDDTVLQTRDSKFKPWRSEAEHATSRSRRLPTILTFPRGWGRNIFSFFQTAVTGNRTPNVYIKNMRTCALSVILISLNFHG